MCNIETGEYMATIARLYTYVTDSAWNDMEYYRMISQQATKITPVLLLIALWMNLAHYQLMVPQQVLRWYKQKIWKFGRKGSGHLEGQTV